MARRALFLDRDGVINVDHAYVHRCEDFDFIEGIFDIVRQAQQASFIVIVITNQAGIGRGYYSEADFHCLMTWVGKKFTEQGGMIDKVYFCPDHPEYGIGKYRRDCTFRKPAPGMLLQAAQEYDVDVKNSLMVGDKPSDMEAAQAAGVGTRLWFTELDEKCKHATAVIHNLFEVIPYLT